MTFDIIPKQLGNWINSIYETKFGIKQNIFEKPIEPLLSSVIFSKHIVTIVIIFCSTLLVFRPTFPVHLIPSCKIFQLVTFLLT